MLVLDDVHVHLGRSHVLQGVTLVASPNEVTALLGRNGVGKTTTLRTIMGLARPTRGKVAWDGERLDALPTNRIVERGLGWVPEHRGNFSALTVLQNLAVAYHGPGRNWTARRDYVFGLFPILRERQRQVARSLSGGEQQMLALAKALVTLRRYLLLDEPTQGLSPLIAADLFRTLAELRGDGMGLLLVEQNPEAALAVSDRVLVMEKGAIRFDARRDEVNVDSLEDLLGVRRSPPRSRGAQS